MTYLAIEIKGQVDVFNDNDELGGLIDNDVDFKVLGKSVMTKSLAIGVLPIVMLIDMEYADLQSLETELANYGM